MSQGPSKTNSRGGGNAGSRFKILCQILLGLCSLLFRMHILHHESCLSRTKVFFLAEGLELTVGQCIVYFNTEHEALPFCFLIISGTVFEIEVPCSFWIFSNGELSGGGGSLPTLGAPKDEKVELKFLLQRDALLDALHFFAPVLQTALFSTERPEIFYLAFVIRSFQCTLIRTQTYTETCTPHYSKSLCKLDLRQVT